MVVQAEGRAHTPARVRVPFLVPAVPCPCLGRLGLYQDPEPVQGRPLDVVGVEISVVVAGEEKILIKADVVFGEDGVHHLAIETSVSVALGRVHLLLVGVAVILLVADRQVTLVEDMEVPIGTTVAETGTGMAALPTEEEEVEEEVVLEAAVHGGDRCPVRTPHVLGLGLQGVVLQVILFALVDPGRGL